MTALDLSRSEIGEGRLHRVVNTWMPAVVTVTTAAVLVEALLLRGASRVLIHIPGVSVASGPLRILTEASRVAFQMALLLLMSLLLLLAGRAWAGRGERILAALLGAFLVLSAAGRLGSNELPIDAALVVVVAAIGGVRFASLTPRSRVPVGLWVAAFVSLGFAQVMEQITADGGGGGAVWGWPVQLGEAAGVLAFLTVPLLLTGRAKRIEWIIGIGVGAVALAVLTTGQAAGRILLLWNLSWSGWLPAYAYAAGLGVLSATLVRAGLGRERNLTAALVFMAAAGFGLVSSYQTGLLAAGLALLPHPSAPAEAPPDLATLKS